MKKSTITLITTTCLVVMLGSFFTPVFYQLRAEQDLQSGISNSVLDLGEYEMLTISAAIPNEFRFYGTAPTLKVSTARLVILASNFDGYGGLKARYVSELALEFTDADGVTWKPVTWEKVEPKN